MTWVTSDEGPENAPFFWKAFLYSICGKVFSGISDLVAPIS
jgi:hypothetical protein